MVCFCFAMNKEAAPFLNGCEVIETKKSGYASILLCKKEEKTFVVLISGIGKGFACAGLAAALLTYDIDKVINAGIAGTLDAKLAPILSCLISSSLVQHDMDTSTLGDPKGMISGINKVVLPSDKALGEALGKASEKALIPYSFGRIASGDIFFPSGDARKKDVIKDFSPLVIDMESACFAQIAYVYGLPYCALRIISDAEHPETEYAQNEEEGIRRIKMILDEYLKEIEA